MPIRRALKTVSELHHTLRMRWRIRIDFQEGKFMFENWNDAYAVLFTTLIRKNGSCGSASKNDASRIPHYSAGTNWLRYWVGVTISLTCDEPLQLSREDLCPAKTCWQALEQPRLSPYLESWLCLSRLLRPRPSPEVRSCTTGLRCR